MVPGYTSANFQQCDIAVMHLSSTARLRQRLLVQLPPNHQMSIAFQQQRACGRDTSRAYESQVTSCTGK